MSIQEISAAIEEVQPHILEYDPDPPWDYNPNAPANNHETSTRYLIIDPILRSKRVCDKVPVVYSYMNPGDGTAASRWRGRRRRAELTFPN